MQVGEVGGVEGGKNYEIGREGLVRQQPGLGPSDEGRFHFGDAHHPQQGGGCPGNGRRGAERRGKGGEGGDSRSEAPRESKAADWEIAIHESREDAIGVFTDGSLNEEGNIGGGWYVEEEVLVYIYPLSEDVWNSF